MKTAIISDIHGNFPALRAVLGRIDEIACGEIICLGDIAGYHCMVAECIAELQNRGAICIAGNHDIYLAKNIPCPRSRIVDEIISRQRDSLTAAEISWLAGLPSSLARGGLSLTHGGWNDPAEEYLFDPSAEYFAAHDGTHFSSGHTHIPLLFSIGGGRSYCNPGSTGQPRDGDPRASFAVFENGVFSLERVAYDIDEIAAAMKTRGYAPRTYEGLYTGRGITADN